MILDNDFYNFTMSQLVWRKYFNTTVKYEFINRTEVPLGRHIPIKDVLLQVNRLRDNFITKEEIKHLYSLNIFNHEYLEWLWQDAEIPQVFAINDDEDLVLEYEGRWADAIFLETPLLSMINSLAGKIVPEFKDAWKVGVKTMAGKVKFLKDHPEIKFMEFGTRRRHSQEWQRYCMQAIIHDAPSCSMVGTSNMLLGKIFSYPPRGTMAHQLFMVACALNEDPIDAQDIVLKLWEKEWGGVWDGALLIALTDTYGTDFFLDHFDPAMAKRWKGFRQDSGDPFEIGSKYLGYWHSIGIDPMEKTIVFSDGLTPDKMLELYKAFGDKTNVVFGWGTNLTNDVGIKPLSMVIKPIMVDGIPCCKISDNLSKATGDPDALYEVAKKVKYKSTFDEKQIY